MKILIAGMGRHGKDEVCRILNEKHGMKFESSSMFAAKAFLYDKLKDKFGYQSFDECYSDRHNHRALWKDEISAYNDGDSTRLTRGILDENDAYCGLRCERELRAALKEGLFDLTFWVDASDRVDYVEGSDSITINKSMCDIIIPNNGSIEDLEKWIDDFDFPWYDQIFKYLNDSEDVIGE